MAATRVVIWADANQEPLISAALREAQLCAVAIGSNSPVETASLSAALGVEEIADVRTGLQREDCDLLWLASAEPIDFDARRLIDELDVLTVSCEPQLESAADMTINSTLISAMHLAPRLRRSPGSRAAADILHQFGQIQCVTVSSRGGPGQGTLFARLFDAMDVVENLCGSIEAIHAGLAGPFTEPPQALAALRGHMTMNLRFKANRCACVMLSDHAGQWLRGVTVLGEGGCLRIDDAGFEWIGPDGLLIDQHHGTERLSPGVLIGMQIRRMLEDRENTEVPPDQSKLLALCETARLSCLTGQEESPRKLLEMLSRP